MSILTNFEKIKQEIRNNSPQNEVEIIAVSKTFSIEHIMPLVEHGHKHFGENKVQEAEKKWKELKKLKKDLSLHMIGRLQSNKAKKAVELFDFIHSLDSEKLAKELSKTPKSIIGKLSREGVYRRSVYKTKTGESPVTKFELVEEIAFALAIEPESLAGLEKSPKLVLKRLRENLPCQGSQRG